MQEAYGPFAALYDRLMYDVDYDAWESVLSGILSDAGIHPENRASLLDCACGTGSVSLRLARRGYSVTASDLSGEMLAKAQAKMRRMGLNIPFIEQDMRSLRTHRSMDAVLCCCDGVNYLTGDGDLEAFFRSAYRTLREGGLLLFDVSSAYKLERILGSNTFGEDLEECTYLWQNRYSPSERLVTMDLIFFVPGEQGLYRRFDETHVQRAYTEDEIRSALAETGFINAECFAFPALGPVEATTERIQWKAVKKG